jgi:hypothetical protein
MAGYETTATTVAFTLYELAKRPEVQAKLRQELSNFKGQDLSVDEINSLEYLEAVCNETCVPHAYQVTLILTTLSVFVCILQLLSWSVLRSRTTSYLLAHQSRHRMAQLTASPSRLVRYCGLSIISAPGLTSDTGGRHSDHFNAAASSYVGTGCCRMEARALAP